jgi:putative transposase
VPVDPGAQAVHGIGPEKLATAPAWPEIAERVRSALEGKTVVIFNSDFDTRILVQTATAHTDGRGRAFDNIFVERLWRTLKYEDVYLKGYASLGELTIGLADYFQFYNAARPHQSMGYRTPNEVYQSGLGGGASIPDHFGDQGATSQNERTGQRCAAASMAEALS